MAGHVFGRIINADPASIILHLPNDTHIGAQRAVANRIGALILCQILERDVSLNKKRGFRDSAKAIA
jgi:hypothetical protein